MEDVIKKAIEGGYVRKIEAISFEFNNAILDPLFWQALGKACGWDADRDFTDKTEDVDWKEVALRFHEENLTDGCDSAVEYLSSLITNVK